MATVNVKTVEILDMNKATAFEKSSFAANDTVLIPGEGRTVLINLTGAGNVVIKAGTHGTTDLTVTSTAAGVWIELDATRYLQLTGENKGMYHLVPAITGSCFAVSAI